MRLLIDPPAPLALFAGELGLVIEVPEAGIPSLYVPSGVPQPDRHMVLGLIQSLAVAVSEDDKDCVAIVDRCTVRLDLNGQIKDLEPSFIVIRDERAAFGVLVAGTREDARRRARQALRYFTGTIRLDVP
jgi:hypothetical protein